MKEPTHVTFFLESDPPDYSLLFPLLQKGVSVKVRVGCSIKNLLCDQFRLETDYLAERIKTIFLDGKPVDDVETAVVKDGSTVALSAAMPGLVGATFRRGGVLAAFRSGITHQGDAAAADHDDDAHQVGTVTIKLFNLLVGELGPVFLNAGIWITSQDVASLLKDRGDTFRSSVKHAEKDGQKIAPEALAALNWAEAPERLLLRVLV